MYSSVVWWIVIVQVQRFNVPIKKEYLSKISINKLTFLILRLSYSMGNMQKTTLWNQKCCVGIQKHVYYEVCVQYKRIISM